MKPAASQVTKFVAAWRNGDPAALEKLATLLYPWLRPLARRHWDT